MLNTLQGSLSSFALSASNSAQEASNLRSCIAEVLERLQNADAKITEQAGALTASAEAHAEEKKKSSRLEDQLAQLKVQLKVISH